MVQLSTLFKMFGIAFMCALCVCCNSSAFDGLGSGQEFQASNEEDITNEMIELIKAITQQRHPKGPIKRFNQVKSQGCFNADFHVDENLPDKLRQGIFMKPGHYPAQIRFANASKIDDREKDLRGMSIKVQGINGKPLWGKDGIQDFTLNSYPALFAATAEDFLSFIKATHDDRVWWYFINPLDPHFDSLLLLLKARKQIANPLLINYWSTTPYRFGDDESVAVKYAVKPCFHNTSQIPRSPDRDYLRSTMAKYLQNQSACFNFMIQFQTDPEKMPVEDASIVWDESESAFHKVATITIEEQVFTSRQALHNCENMRFNPWQSLPAHKPVGGINRTRKMIYEEIGAFRTAINE